MNDKIVTNSSSGNHAYHAYIMQKNSYCRAVKREILKRTECYFEEDADNINQHALKVADTKPVNDVFRQKHDVFLKNEKDIVTRTQCYLDLMQVNHYYPTDIDYVMTLTRNPESFCLMSITANEGKYQIII